MKTKLFAISLLFLLIAVSCKEDTVQVMPDYIYEIPQTNLKTKALVGCYYAYYPSISTVWTTLVDTPTIANNLAQYDPIVNPAVMRVHTDSASKYGIDYFIFEWNEVPTAKLNAFKLIAGFQQQPKVKADSIKMITKYNLGHLGANPSKLLKRPNDPLYNAASATLLTSYLNEVNFIDTAYLRKSFYQKVEGRPIVMFTFTSTNANVDWAFAIDTLRAQITKNSGVNPYIVIEYQTAWSPPELFKTVFDKGDAVSMQNMKCTTYDRYVGYFSYMDMNWALWNSTLNSWGKDFVPTVWPAYSRKNETNPSAYYDISRTPANYINYCNVAKRNMGSKQMVIINSWNEFKFGAALEPCKGFGSDYLKITKDQFSAK